MVNTAALSGSTVTRSVGVVEVFSRAATGALDVSSEFGCTSTNAPVLGATTSGCELELNGSEAGGASLSVQVSGLSSGARPYGGSVPMRVWFPINVTVSIANALLRRISGPEGPTSVYQVSTYT